MTFTVERKRRTPGAVPPSRVTPTPRRPMSHSEIADQVADIKELARRMRPPMNNAPDAWHVDKDAIVQAAIRLEDALRNHRQMTPAD
jgi:hypothetical protein